MPLVKDNKPITGTLASPTMYIGATKYTQGDKFTIKPNSAGKTTIVLVDKDGKEIRMTYY